MPSGDDHIKRAHIHSAIHIMRPFMVLLVSESRYDFHEVVEKEQTLIMTFSGFYPIFLG